MVFPLGICVASIRPLDMIPVSDADEGNNSKKSFNISIALNLCGVCNLGPPCQEKVYSEENM